MEDLQVRWRFLLNAKTSDLALADSLFIKLSKNYDSRKRPYHNFTHIAAMLDLSDQYAAQLQQKDVVDLAIFYHDVIYNPLRKDNEERSAQRAVRELKQMRFSKDKIQLVETYILATKTHDLIGFDSESDLAYLLDFDLSVLGADWETYYIYSQNIRKEYHVYPDFMYDAGRAKVLQHFLNKSTIYWTKAFRKKRETQARKNIEQEIKLLKK